MCTLIALHRCVPGANLVVAANRDEYLDRPAESPALRATPAGPVLAPLDRRAGGTWLGLRANGLFAALTNRPSPRPDPRRRSRGLLVLDALGHASAREAAAEAASIPTGMYNPFNLFVADAQEAFVVSFDEAPRLLPLRPGAHVIGNADPADRSAAKVARLQGRVEAAARSAPDELLDVLADVCRGHETEPLAGACVHAGAYGTRSSTLLRLGSRPEVLRHASGPPCRAPYQDLSFLLPELVHADESAAGGTIARKAS